MSSPAITRGAEGTPSTVLERFAFGALALFVFAIPWERTVEVPFFGGAGTPFGLLAAGLTVMSVFGRGRLELRPPALVLVIIAIFASWSALTYFWSSQPAKSILEMARLAQLLVFVWLVWQLSRTEGHGRRLMQAYVLGAYVSLVLVLWSFVTGDAFAASSQSIRYTFDRANPNYLALSLALAIPMAWHLFATSGRSAGQLMNGLYIIFAVFVIALTASRGGFAAAAVALLIVPWSFWRLGAVRMVFVLAVYVGLAYAAFGLIPEENVQRLSQVGSAEVVEGLDTRTRIWAASWTLLQHEPHVMLRGAGIGAHPEAVRPYLGRAQEAHNAFLSLAVELGIVGFALFMLILLVAVVPNLGLEPQRRMFFIVLAATMIMTLLPANWEDQKALWFGIALMTTGRAFTLTGFPSLRGSRADRRTST